MTESMKFGPEWLRALSAQQPARYQLAEFRYGREEMLALFSANLPPPESLKSLHGLYVEKAQPPLALNTMSDEETRMWNRGINSDAVLRSVGKGERGGGLRGSGGGGAGGRGGRGRGFYRGPSGERYEESGDAPFPRQRPFDRSQSERGRDSWSERNGGEGRGGGRDREREREREPNWRRGQRNSGGGGDDDDWRPYSSSNKWSVSGGRSNNWRDEDNYDMNQTHSIKNSNHHLPEWATEKNSEGGGTFDSSGAFHGPSDHIEEDEPPKKNENRISGKERDRERDRDKSSNHKNDPLNKEKDVKTPETRESPKESKPPERDEEVYQKPESSPPRLHSPKRNLTSAQMQSHPLTSQPSSHVPSQQQTQHQSHQHQQSSQQSQRILKTPSPPIPSPPPVERKTPPQPHHPPPQLLQQHLQSQPAPHELKSSPQHIDPIQPPTIRQVTMEHPEDALSTMTDDLAADLVAKLMEDEEKQDKQWYYRDPQGQVQGPFTCTEMAEWFQSGYFTLNLLVRRACDPNYAPLGELIKLWGCIPFLPEFHPLNKEAATMVNNQIQENFIMQQYQQQMRNMLYRQQQSRTQPQQAPKLHDWLDNRPTSNNLMDPILPPPYQPQVGINALNQHTNTNNHLRALLMQLQQQQAKAEPAPSPVVESLLSLAHQQQATAGQTPIQALLRQMQQQSSKLQHHHQQHPPSTTSTIDSVWNGGGNWSQWGHVNTKGIKTEQQVLEEQMREFYRKRDELLQEEEEKGKEEEEKAKKEREKQQQEAAKREEENLARRRAEEEEIRKKQEASRRAEVERQKKGEEKRRKEEEKRKKEEEKRRKEEENRERERLREEERKKKEAEEAKKRSQQAQAAADVMAKVQRSQWCPPTASNTSILDIQRSEREQQQLLRGLQQQAQQHHEQQQQQQQQQNIGKGGIQLKWTEPTARPPTQVESLADIQAEQQRQFLKQLEKEKEREKEKVSATAVSGPTLGSWSQGLSWGNSAWQTPGLNPASGLSSSQKGFWEYDKAPERAGSGRLGNVIQSQAEPPKSVQNKAKREEQAVMKLFSQPSQSEEDEFSQWCTRQLSALHANVDIPTFVSFLREIDSPADIGEYVRMYLGESKEASDFARQFVERRGVSGGGRLNSSLGLHSSAQDDRDFQQVKGKSKKTKKGRMQKVDTRMLGFSTTAAPDRINVGDREYPE